MIVSVVPLKYRIVAVMTGPELMLSTGISVTVSVPSNKVHVVVVFVFSLI